MNRIDGKIAVVTGGTQGLGAAIARTFASAGAAGIAIVGRGAEKGRKIAEAIEAETGLTPSLSTTGGTSDARFLSKLCPVAEFGLVNATMHKTNEAVAVADLYALTRVYAAVIARMLPARSDIRRSNADSGIGSAGV